MKRCRLFAILLTLMCALCFVLVGCGGSAPSTSGDGDPSVSEPVPPTVGGSDSGSNGGASAGDNDGNTDNDGGAGESGSTDDENTGKRSALVVYFSCTSRTESVAVALRDELGCDIYEITPVTPYTPADLNYNSDCRANAEQNDPTCRPEISGGVDNMARYDVVFVGYPIWWGIAPRIVYTFMESYDFTGKTIVPFCTSGSSGIGSSAVELRALAPNAVWKSGARINAANASAIRSGIATLIEIAEI